MNENSIQEGIKYRLNAIKNRRLRWEGNEALMEERRNALKILTGKPTGKRHLRRPSNRWEDDVRMNFEEVGVNTGN